MVATLPHKLAYLGLVAVTAVVLKIVVLNLSLGLAKNRFGP